MTSHTEPSTTGFAPTPVDPELSIFCRTPRPVLLITPALIKILQTSFGSSDNAKVKSLAETVWSPELRCDNPTGPVNGGTHLGIGDAYSADREKSAILPSITVAQGPFQLRDPMTLGDKVGQTSMSKVARGQEYVVLIDGTHTISITSEKKEEAVLLGGETFFRLIEYMHVIRDDLRLAMLRPVALAPPTERKGEARNVEYVCTITVKWAAQLNWTNVLDAPPIKRIGLSQKI